MWDPSNYSDIDVLVLPFDKVWSPDITLYDNGDAELEGSKDYLVMVYSTGSCFYNYPTIIKVLCKIDVIYFPFDTQSCPLKLGSWSHHGFEINVTNRDPDGDMTSFVPNTEWDLLSVPVKRRVFYYGCCPEPYPDVTFYVTMKRKPLFYVLNLLFPCLLITAVALLGFILPPDAGEKVSLEITVLLSLAVFLLVVSETLPATSDGFPYIGIYFAVAMLLVSLSTLLTVLVLNIHHKGHLNRPVPRWVRKIVLNYLGKIVRVQNERSVHPFETKAQRAGGDDRSFQHETYINGYQEFQNKEHAHYNGNGTTGRTKHHQGGNLFFHHDHHRKNDHETSNIIERPLGSEFNQRPSTTSAAPLGNVPSSVSRGSVGGADTSLDASVSLSMGNDALAAEQRNPILSVLKQQLRMLEREEVRMDSKMKHDHLSSEWKRVGIVLDRVFLLTFLFVMVVSSLGILLQLGT
ncbi:neuronal acetylcholine receptor subunit alpha-10-like [Plakobranchus ocellatus]|uniref:Neuronal acetylcholine receptor subunit alpha-10-like n=1 Tax=Plakobranchus ocellatus TaxID=259542 RepID=A0AAV4CQT5_9GAST|nr:neuronal acetylcholine receptor subunit alpha-10-like [Plakobranchus ocellatus]